MIFRWIYYSRHQFWEVILKRNTRSMFVLNVGWLHASCVPVWTRTGVTFQVGWKRRETMLTAAFDHSGGTDRLVVPKTAYTTTICRRTGQSRRGTLFIVHTLPVCEQWGVKLGKAGSRSLTLPQTWLKAEEAGDWANLVPPASGQLCNVVCFFRGQVVLTNDTWILLIKVFSLSFANTLLNDTSSLCC